MALELERGEAPEQKAHGNWMAIVVALVTDGAPNECESTPERLVHVARQGVEGSPQVLTFVNMADLMRIKGVGAEFAELLQAAGVDTIKELRTRNAENLFQKLEETNAAKSLTRRVPSLDMVKDFIAQAGSTDPSVTY